MIDHQDEPSTESVIAMMKDVYIFLETRLKCFSEETRVTSLESETDRITEIYDEVAKIGPYLFRNINVNNEEYAKIERKLLALLEEAKLPKKEVKNEVNGEEKLDDVLLGCVCIITSPIDQQFSAEKEDECEMNGAKVEQNIKMVAQSYIMAQHGVSLKRDMMEDLYLDLERSHDCGKITKNHQNQFHQILK